MGAEDVRRQALNVFRIKLLEAKLFAVEAGTITLSHARMCCGFANDILYHRLSNRTTFLPHNSKDLPIRHRQ